MLMTVDVSDTHRREIIEQLEFRVCPLIDQQKELYLLFSPLLFNGQFVLSMFVITLRFPSKELEIFIRFLSLIVRLFSAREFVLAAEKREKMEILDFYESVYEDLESSIDEQQEEFATFGSDRRHSVILRTKLSVR